MARFPSKYMGSMSLKIKLHVLGIFFFSVLCAFTLASMPIDAFMDRINYLNYAKNSDEILFSYLQSGLLKIVFNEPAWLFLNTGLSKIFQPEVTLRVIIFFSSFITIYVISKNYPRYFFFVVLFLLSPLVMTKYIVHLRQGLAISIFLLGWFSLNSGRRLFFYLLSPFVHSSFFFVLLFLFIKWLCKKLNMTIGIQGILYLMLGGIVGFFLPYIAQALDARQAQEYAFKMADVSGLGFIFWLFVLILYAFQGGEFLKKNIFQVGTLIFYLSTYFLIEITGRIFESTVVLVLLSSLMLNGWRKKSFTFIYIAFFVALYFKRYSEPWFGWGA